jgi:hypothetical protein
MRRLAFLTVLSLSTLLGATGVPPEKEGKPDPLKDVELPPRAKPAAKVAPKEAAAPVKIKAHPTPDSGARAALQDANTSPFQDSPYWRYLWIDDEDEELFKATALVVNYVSRSTFLYRPEIVPCPGGHLLRVDLRVLAPREDDFVEMARVWESLAFDPAFSLLITRDVLELGGLDLKLLPKVKHKGVRKEKRPAEEGKPAVEVLVPYEEEVDVLAAGVDVLRLDAPDLDASVMASLRSLTISDAPIVDYRYFVYRALSTVQDDGAYKTIFGGLYYQLRGVKKAKDVKGKEKATDEDVYFESLGVGNVAAGETYERLLDRVRGDLRPSVFLSNVTGKPRSVVVFHTPSEREGHSWGAVTWDLRDKDVDVKSHPVLSQIKPKIAAQEAIFPGPNGMPVFALFNGEGALQDEAPPDVVADRTVPSPHTTRLQGAISCIRCHGPHETWQPLSDDLALLFTRDRLVPLADLSKKGDFGSDLQDRLYGLHSVLPGFPPGPQPRQKRVLDVLLSRSRQDFMLTVGQATGEWKRLGGRQTEVAVTAAQKISDIVGGYWYTPVDARTALLEIGLDVPGDQAAEVLDDLLPPEGGEPVLGVLLEDARAEALAAGQKIGRPDWALVRSFVAGRTNRAAKELLKGKP